MKYALLVLFAGLACGCKKDPIPNGNVVPPALEFVLLDKQGNNLLASIATPIRISAVKSNGETGFLGQECAGGGCTMIRAANRYSTRNPKYDFYYSSLDAALSSSEGVKTWYIELGGKTDTLYYDVQQTRPNDPSDKFDTKAVIFNGRVALQEDPEQPPLYVFRRRH